MGGFITERVKGLISKKIGAAVIGEAVIGASAPEIQGMPTIAYIIVQGFVDAAKHYTDARYRPNPISQPEEA